MRQRQGPGRLPGPLRLRPTPAAAGRLPLRKAELVDNALTDQTSILRFIEDNWQLGRLGDQSLDAEAGSLGNMFDFDPNDKRAPKVFLDPESGLVVKTAPATAVSPDDKPLPLPHDGGSSQGGGGPGAGSPPPPGHHGAASKVKAVKLRLTCTTKGGGRKVTVTCVGHGAGTAKTTAVRFRIVRGSGVLATASTRPRHARASAVLRPRRALTKGTYVLRVTITQRGSVTATHSSVRLG